MLIIIILSVLIVAGVVLARSGDYNNAPFLKDLGAFCFIISGLALVVVIILIPVNKMHVESNIVKLKEVQRVIETARESDLELESAAFQLKIADWNQWLAGQKYWNGTVFGLWIPDKIETIENIR